MTLMQGKLLMVVAFFAFFHAGGVIAGENERPLSATSYTGKIIDAHGHPRRADPAQLTRHFAEVSAAGVERMLVMHTPNDYRKKKRRTMLRRAAAFANVSVLCSSNVVGFIFRGALDEARGAISEIALGLRKKACVGIGELGLRHFDKSRKGRQPVVEVPLDQALIHEVLALADHSAVPVVLHIEPVDSQRGTSGLAEIKRWYKRTCRKYPKARLVAAHTGMMSPRDLEELLHACANLFADFKVLHSRGALRGFAELHGVNDLDFRFFETWAKLFERYPDRIMFASDWKDARHGYTETSYGDHIAMVRRMIGSLDPAVQNMIAYTNAHRVFNLP